MQACAGKRAERGHAPEAGAHHQYPLPHRRLVAVARAAASRSCHPHRHLDCTAVRVPARAAPMTAYYPPGRHLATCEARVRASFRNLGSSAAPRTGPPETGHHRRPGGGTGWCDRSAARRPSIPALPGTCPPERRRAICSVLIPGSPCAPVSISLGPARAPPGGARTGTSAAAVAPLICHPLLQRDDRVVGDLDAGGADLAAALGDVAQAESVLPAQRLAPVAGVQRVHVQLGVPAGESRPGVGRATSVAGRGHRPAGWRCSFRLSGLASIVPSTVRVGTAFPAGRPQEARLCPYLRCRRQLPGPGPVFHRTRTAVTITLAHLPTSRRPVLSPWRPESAVPGWAALLAGGPEPGRSCSTQARSHCPRVRRSC